MPNYAVTITGQFERQQHYRIASARSSAEAAEKALKTYQDHGHGVDVLDRNQPLRIEVDPGDSNG